ncbi:radical SAM protein [Scandinavium sp. M-37]|uniref:radical SAM protein n=1 Tax=Scandinavium sp. M-37 TaxID=3373077 RepID=UPI0037474F17
MMSFTMESFHQPSRLAIQWHITDKCNLHCQHCYQTSWRGGNVPLKSLIHTADKLLGFYQQLSRDRHLPFLLTITGGEPFTQPNFLELLQYLDRHPIRPSIAILTNGSLITAEKAKKLAQLNISFIQMSVEGAEKTHNVIRGRDNLKKVIKATQVLRKENIRVLWSFTAHQKNASQFEVVATLAKKHNVSRIWADRMIPSRDAMPDVLNKEQTQQFFENMLLTKIKLSKKTIIKRIMHKLCNHQDTEVAMLRALQFKASGETPYHCHAGDSFLTVMPDGTVYPCRRLPISVGNLHTLPLMKIYQQSPFLNELRDFIAPQACRKCAFMNGCKGGLRCLSFATSGDPFGADPGCHEAMSDS